MRKVKKHVLIFSSRYPIMSGLPRFSAEIYLADDESIVFDFSFYGIYQENFSRFGLNVDESSWIFLQ